MTAAQVRRGLQTALLICVAVCVCIVCPGLLAGVVGLFIFRLNWPLSPYETYAFWGCAVLGASLVPVVIFDLWTSYVLAREKQS